MRPYLNLQNIYVRAKLTNDITHKYTGDENLNYILSDLLEDQKLKIKNILYSLIFLDIFSGGEEYSRVLLKKENWWKYTSETETNSQNYFTWIDTVL